MPKLHLIIADNDEAYVESIINYIINNYSQRFQVSSFTKEEYLLNYLSDNKRNVDILLICPEWYTDSIPKEKIYTPIILSGGMVINEIMDCEIVNKYQRGDKLVSSIMNCYAEKNPNKYFIEDRDKKTKVIAVYSPIGGVGKTSIATGSSMNSAENGKSVFYLNLENIQSTPSFFYCESSQNLSNMLYYIKERKKNNTLKIEGIKCVDSGYNIHYFTPPDSVIDLNETSSDDIQYLIHQLKITNNYDVIFIDMSSNIDERNISILRASDRVILVLSQDDVSITKINSFMHELEILSKRNNLDISEKITIVLNKYKQNRNSEIEELDLNGKSIEVKIPIVNEPISFYRDSFRKEMKIEFNDAIEELLRII